MCRYFQKGKGTPTYAILYKYITDDELAEWRDEFGKANSLYNGAQESISKSNFAFLAMRYQKNYCPDLAPGIGDLIVWMLQSRMYSLAIGWVSGSNGFAIDSKRIAAYWRSINIDTYQRMSNGALWTDVRRILFGAQQIGISACNEPIDMCFNPQYSGQTINEARALSGGLGQVDSMGSDSGDDSGNGTQTGPFLGKCQLPVHILAELFLL